MMEYKNALMRFTKKRTFKYGIPFFLFVVGGSYGLREFTELRYRYKPVSTIREKIADLGIEMKKSNEVTLESEYEKIKDMDIDNWENIRIPRPWEKDGKEI